MAANDTLLIFTPFHNEPPSSNYATLGLRNQHPVLVFDGNTNWSGVFTGVMPRQYSATTGVTIYIHYSMATATSGDIDWDISFERIGDQQQDVDSDGFAAVNSVDGTVVPGTSGFVDIVNITFTDGADMDSVAAGELFRLKITRDAASDTDNTKAELHAIEIKET